MEEGGWKRTQVWEDHDARLRTQGRETGRAAGRRSEEIDNKETLPDNMWTAHMLQS